MTNLIIKIRPLKMEDYQTVLLWSKDQEFCLANGWDLNRSAEEIYSWWKKCVHNDTPDFIADSRAVRLPLQEIERNFNF